MRDTVKLTVCLCVCIPANCLTVEMQRKKLTASIIGFYSHVLLDFGSWISKLKLLSLV